MGWKGSGKKIIEVTRVLDPAIGDDFSGDRKLEERKIPLASGIDLAGDEICFGDGEEGILVVTDGGGILDANTAAERMLGMTQAEMASAGRDGIFRDPRLEDAIDERRREESFRGRLRLVRGDETSFEAEVGTVDIGGGKVGVVFHESRPVGEANVVEGFFKALVENRAGAVILSGEDGVIRYASPSVESILGHEPEEVIGRPLEDRLHPDDREKASGVFGPLGGRVSGVFRLLHGGGGWVEVEGSIENLLADPEINGVALVGRKRSVEEESENGFEEKLRSMVERLAESERRLGESERLFRTTFDEAPAGIAHVGVDGRWIRVNKKLCEILGHTKQELLGRHFQEITHTEDLASDLETMKAMIEDGKTSASAEKRFVRGDLSHVWVNVSASVIRDYEGDGEPRYFICTIEDITALKEAQIIAQSLTGRETKVLKLLGSGMTNRDIAVEMNFSLSSAKVHVGRVIAKLGASDRTNAAVKAAGLGIL